jgi:hypothetical protein
MEAAVFEKDAVYELESEMAENFNARDLLIFTTDVTCSDTYKSTFGKWSTHSVHATRQASPLVAPQCILPRIVTDEYVDTPPSLASATSSHNTSPISPVTPGLETAHCVNAQLQIVSPIAVTTTSYPSVRESFEKSSAEEHGLKKHKGVLFFSEPELSFMPPPGQFSEQNEPMPRDFDFYGLHFSSNCGLMVENFALYPPFGPMPLSASPFEARHKNPWDTSEFHPTGTADTNPPAYSFQNYSESLNGINDCAIPQPFTVHEKSAAPEHDFTFSAGSLQPDVTATHVYTSGAVSRRGAVRGRVIPAVHWSTKRCDICGNEFTGQ